MKQTAIRYGMYSLVVILILSCVHFFILLKTLDYYQMEIAGYLTMLLSMIFVYFGLRYYRDEKNNGVLTFGQGLKLGTLIVLFPSIFFGLFDVFYVKVINPDWVNDALAGMKRSGLSDAEYQARSTEFTKQVELFGNPFFQFFIMFLTVFIIGFIVTIISSLALRRNNVRA
jgi:hypothetical protein